MFGAPIIHVEQSWNLFCITSKHYRPFADTARLPPVPLLPSPVSPSSRPPPASPSSYRPLSLPVDCASAASSFLTDLVVPEKGEKRAGLKL
ncbi:hypothetical protein PRIPAC_98104 [Pristionchus pacificus]|uniref:Uncharacterized protein n=1 Tax=Pristionchus pacificus TaxID=54126 RepID=A0A2A6BDJ2_PRIPA|nr:hypothetical protein PRIPAC_98104 [Pristionchus pacificus]|eukprot:PDM63939.1 hypothetical protein PRIPAC_53898 [Pristionchus pacificus]